MTYSRSTEKALDLYGNGVPIVPDVHAVMAWAARYLADYEV
jgi:hypothetical protein